MSSSHATKSRRRYRYCVTRTDRLDGARAWRVSAHDLEQLMVDIALPLSWAEQRATLGFS